MPRCLVPHLLCVLLTTASSVSAAGSLKVGVYQNRPHVFLDKNDRPRGLFVDLLNQVAKQEGWRLDYVRGSWSQCLTRLQNGKIDLLPAVSYSDSRAQRYNFGDVTVIVNWATVYTKPPSEIENVMGLRHKRIAVVQGDISYEALRRMLKRFAVPCEFSEVEEFEEVMKLVRDGRADAGLVGRLFGTQHEKDYGLQATPVLCSPMQLRFAAPTGSKTDVLRTLDHRIAAMKKDKQSAYYKAMTKWVLPLEEWEFPAWAVMGLAGLTALVVFLSGAGFLLRRQVRKKTAELALINEDLGALTLKIELAQEQERKRLAAALHDSVIQSLSLSRIKLGALHKQIRDNESREIVRDLRTMFDTALLQMRTLTFELSPPVLYELGLGPAIEWLGDELQKKHAGIVFVLDRPDDPVDMDEVVSILVFQSVRELLANAGKHASAKKVTVTMAIENDAVAITIMDDGKGFNVERASGHSDARPTFGLFSIRERMRQLGGSFELVSRRGKGTTAMLRAPLRIAPGKGVSRAG